MTNGYRASGGFATTVGFRQYLVTSLVASAAGAVILLSSTDVATYALLVLFGLVGSGIGARGVWELTTRGSNLIQRLSTWHWAWAVVLVSGLVFRRRGVEAAFTDPFDLSTLFRIALMTTVGFYVLAYMSSDRDGGFAAMLRGLVLPLTLFAVVALLSTAWSVYPLWTLYRATEFLIDVCLLALIVTRCKTVIELKTLMDWNAALLGALLITVVGGLVLAPELATYTAPGFVGVQISGVWPILAANSVGDVGALLVVLVCSRLLAAREGRLFYLIALAVSATLLLLSQSRSPIVGCLVGVAVVLYFTRRVSMLLLVTILLMGCIILTGALDDLWQLFLRGQDAQGLATFTGRVQWWRQAVETWAARPWLGYGAYAGGQFAVMSGSMDFISAVHNTWVQLLVDTSFWGLIPVLLAVVSAWMCALRLRHVFPVGCPEQRLLAAASGFLTVLTIRSVFTQEIIWHPPLNFMLVIACLEVLRRRANVAR